MSTPGSEIFWWHKEGLLNVTLLVIMLWLTGIGFYDSTVKAQTSTANMLLIRRWINRNNICSYEFFKYLALKWTVVTTRFIPTLTCSAPAFSPGFLLENDMPRIIWVFLCNYKLCVNHLGIKIKLTLVRPLQSLIKPDVPLRYWGLQRWK